MPLVGSKEMFQEAMAGRYAVAAFNANSFEHIQAIIETAQEERSPVIVAYVESVIQYFGLAICAEITKVAADMVDVPVVMHLDHGPSYEWNARCVQAGFTSVMFDGSKLPFEENVRATRQIVAMAHARGVPVEGELGRMFSRGDKVADDQVRGGMTDPAGAKTFLEQSGADSLAIAVGSIHGLHTQSTGLDLPRIEAIRDATHAPLVLHGSSGVTNDALVAGIERGIAKINVGTYIGQGFIAGIKQGIHDEPDATDPRPWLSAAREVMKERVREKMRLFKSSGRVPGSGKIADLRDAWSGLAKGDLEE